jgi:hypothetical protein
MTRIPVTLIENLVHAPPQSNLQAPRTPLQTANPFRPVVVAASNEATCMDAAGHVVACSVCKKLGKLERLLYVLVSAIISSFLTGVILWRFYKRQI